MTPSNWRRAVAGLGILGLLSFAGSGSSVADFASHAAPPSPASQPGPGAGGPPEGPLEVPDPTRQPAPDTSPAGATTTHPSPRPAVYTETGIPRVALGAYRNAADLLGASDPSCHLHWSLLAGIGRVESDHGRHGGSSLDRSGETVSPIVGPALDGSGNTARILDSDQGRLDGDARFDRAVGPMQFLPGTWRIAGADGDGDGTADPSNVFDAALSAGRYLCAGDVDLSDAGQLQAAVFGYNHSASYVDLVLRIAEAYRNGDTPEGPPAPEGVTTPEPLEPTPPESDLPPATSGEPFGEQSDTPKPGDSDQPEPHTPNTPGGGGTPSETDEPEPPGEEEDESDPAPSEEPSEPPEDGSSPPDDSEPSAPTVDDVSTGDGAEAKGPAGTDVTITGSGLEDATVRFGGKQASIDESESDDEIVVDAPAYPVAGTVDVTVHGEDGEPAEVDKDYTYVPAITGIDPPEGSTEGGEQVTLTGTSLKDADVDFGGTEVDPSSSEANPGTELRVTTPPADESVEVEVTASHEGQTSESVPFVYEEPSVSAQPSSGIAGRAHEEVTLTASHTEFAAEPEVTWSNGEDSESVEVHERSETELVISLPEHEPGTIDITVAPPEETDADDLTTTFTYYRPDVESVEPQPVAPGEPATLHGSGIDGDSSVLIAGREEEIRVQEDESGNPTFRVPEELGPGHHELTVMTSGVSSDPYEFDVDPDAAG